MANFKDIKRFNGSSWDTYKLGVEETEISDGVGSVSQGAFPMTKGKIGTWTANRFAGFPSHNVWYQYSIDGGATWNDLGEYYETENDLPPSGASTLYGEVTFGIFTKQYNYPIIPGTVNRTKVDAKNYRFRVIMDFYNHTSYADKRPVLIYLGYLNQIIIGLSNTSPSTKMWVTAKRTKINETHTITSNDDGTKEITRENAMTDIMSHTWREASNFIKVPIAGDSGFNDIKTNLGYFGNGEYRFLQFEFGMDQWPSDGRTPGLMSIWGYSNSIFDGGNELSNENRMFIPVYGGSPYIGTKSIKDRVFIYSRFPMAFQKGLTISGTENPFYLATGINLQRTWVNGEESPVGYGKKGFVLASMGNNTAPYWRKVVGNLEDGDGEGSLQQLAAVATGINSTALGGTAENHPTILTIASGENAFAAGASAQAKGYASAALNRKTSALQYGCLATGGGTEAGRTQAEFNEWVKSYTDKGTLDGTVVSYSEGNSTYCYDSSLPEDEQYYILIKGYGDVHYHYKRFEMYASALGELTKAKGRGSLAFGNKTQALGSYSVAGGSDSKADAFASIALGDNCQANATGSVAVCGYNIIGNKGLYSFTAGDHNEVDGSGNAVFGTGNIVQGKYSAIFGSTNIVSEASQYVLTAGFGNKATTNYTTLLGQNLLSYSNISTIIGKNNMPKNNLVFAIGWGNTSDWVNRRNIFEVLTDGRAKVYASPVDSEDVANKAYVDEKTSNASGYLGTVSDPTKLFDILNVRAGDYCRASANFIMFASDIDRETYEEVHTGDLIIAKNGASGDGHPNSTTLSDWDIIHTEDISNYVTLDTNQNITGVKDFQEITLSSGMSSLKYNELDFYSMTKYGVGYIRNEGSDIYLPSKSGTIALLSDIPTDYVTLNTQQAITGMKTFTNLDVDTGFLFLQGLIKFGQESYEDSMGRTGWRLYAQQIGGPVPGDDTNDFWKINFPHDAGEQTLATQEWVADNYVTGTEFVRYA